MTQMTDLLDEEDIIKLIWKKIGSSRKRDPFDDDASWFSNTSEKFVVAKSDMLVETTDAPRQMSPAQIARKSIISCVSDFAAKGVEPAFCLVSLGLPRKKATRKYLNGWVSGFVSVQKEYGLKIIGGDTNATTTDPVIDCTIFGFSNSMVKRNGAKPGQLVGVSGSFGHQAAGLLVLLGKARSRESSFKKRAIDSVLNPRARLELGVKASSFLTSCTDSSDGLAISLYHLAESSRVKFVLDEIPVSPGLEEFSMDNSMKSSDLALFGGEEFELVCTFDPKHEKALSQIGIRTIGRAHRLTPGEKPSVIYSGKKVKRSGWVHFKRKLSST
ncbi:MAG: thiamine-phosphate kinase [Nitrososphaerales archaeon]|jgi:thiamine-monophosphate kinase